MKFSIINVGCKRWGWVSKSQELAKMRRDGKSSNKVEEKRQKRVMEWRLTFFKKKNCLWGWQSVVCLPLL